MKTIPSLALPTLQQKLKWVLDPVGYLEKTQTECGDIFRAVGLGFGGEGEMIMVNHPQALQQLLTQDRKQFSAPGNLNELLLPLVGNYSTIMIDGDRHRKRRQLVMPSFHGDRLRHYGELIQEITHQVMEQQSYGQVFQGREATQDLSLQVIFKTVFGFSDGGKYDHLKQLLTEISELFKSPLTSALLFFPKLQKDWGPWSPWGRFVRRRQEFDQLLYQEIRDRRANPDPNRNDILSLLMDSKDEQGEPMTDEELRDELMTLLFAGNETTATAMAWALYWLHRRPDVKAKLLAELDALGDRPEPMELMRLPYLNALCNETLRIYPVAMLTFPRRVEETVEMLGYTLKPGTMVMGCMYQTHQREDLYPNHHLFNPDRFLEKNYSPYEFLPFGGGVRRCLGEALAQFEMKTAIATIMKHYNLAQAEEKPETPRRRGVTLAPANGVRLIMQGKRTAPNPAIQLDLVTAP